MPRLTSLPQNGSAAPTAPKRPRHSEDDLQKSIVRFTAAAVDPGAMLLMAIPNGGQRNPKEAARMTGVSSGQRDLMSDDDALRPAGLGVLPGAADLLLLLPGGRIALVEIKTEAKASVGIGALPQKAGVLSKAQRRFRAGAERLEHDYRVVRSLVEWHALLIEKGVPMRRSAVAMLVGVSPIGR